MRHPDGVGGAGLERPPVEPSADADPLESGLAPAGSRHPAGPTHQSSICASTPSARTDSSRRRSASSQHARSSMPGSRSIQRPCVSAMSMRSGWNTSKASVPPGSQTVVQRPQHGQPLAVVAQVQERPERHRDERRTCPGRAGRACRPDELERDAVRRRPLPGQVEHHRRAVDADDRHAGERGRHRHPAGADSDLEHGPPDASARST